MLQIERRDNNANADRIDLTDVVGDDVTLEVQLRCEMSMMLYECIKTPIDNGPIGISVSILRPLCVI